MAAPLTSIGPISPPAISSPGLSGSKPSDAFQAVFSDAVDKVEQFGKNAQASVERFLSGEDQELHRMVLDEQQAELSFDLFMQVRNKVVSAYQEVMRMQI